MSQDFLSQLIKILKQNVCVIRICILFLGGVGEHFILHDLLLLLVS